MIKKYIPHFICRLIFFYLSFFICFIQIFIGASAFAQSACPAVSVTPSSVDICNGCTTLTATAQGTVATTSYSVSSIPYVPFSFNTGTPILVNIDDKWSDSVIIPFCFEFYGNTYSKCLIGSNDVISFNLANANQNNTWQISAPVPDPTVSDMLNCIMGPRIDIDPSVGGNIYYNTYGTYPCRSFVVSWNQVPMYSCNSNITTTQIVLYETTNIIDIFIQSNPTCFTWNGGAAIEGIQNSTGTQAVVVPGRNFPTQWNVTNDGQRFTPTGALQYSLTWYAPGNVAIGNTASIIVCLSDTTTYTATIVNNSCNGSITVSETATVNLIGIDSINISKTDIFCSGNMGIATANVFGSFPTYTYLWDPGGQTTQTITGLSIGTYTLTVAGANGCTDSSTVTIAPSPQVMFSFSAISNVDCFGNNSGSASVNVLTGIPPYSYLWNPGGQTTSTDSGLSEGTYTLSVTDSAGCSYVDSITITSPLVLQHSILPSTNVNCFGYNFGGATINVSGGTLPYNYLWSNLQTTQTLTDLATGTYTIVVTDANACSFTDSVGITSPPPLTHSFSGIANVDCFGNSTGAATVDVSGGTIPYTYSWNSIPVQTTPTADTLYAGSFTVMVIDSNGCSFSDSVIITSPTGLGVYSQVTSNMHCFADSVGSATITPFGGTPVYDYLWNPGLQTTSTVTGLSAGVYTIEIKDHNDNNGCIINTIVQITEPALLASISSHVNVLCFNDSTGSASVVVAGGTPSYHYLWNSGQTTSGISNLPEGNYSVMITDTNGCQDSSIIIITQPLPLTTSITPDTSIRLGTSITENCIATGGSPVYSYLWMPGGDTTSAITITPAVNTTYTVQVSDANGCSSGQFNTTITVVPVPVATISVAPGNIVFYPQTICFTADSINTNSLLWDFADNSTASGSYICHDFSKSGTYCVTLLETNTIGCSDSAEVCVEEIEAVVPNAFSPNGDGTNDVFFISLNPEGITYFRCEIYDRWGLKMADLVRPKQGWEGFNTAGSPAFDGTYYFVLSIEWGNMKSIHKEGFFTLVK